MPTKYPNLWNFPTGVSWKNRSPENPNIKIFSHSKIPPQRTFSPKNHIKKFAYANKIRLRKFLYNKYVVLVGIFLIAVRISEECVNFHVWEFLGCKFLKCKIFSCWHFLRTWSPCFLKNRVIFISMEYGLLKNGTFSSLLS